MAAELRKTGINVVGDIPWGTHFCHFYETTEDLLDLLIPYFKAGLENNEFCLWVASEPLGEADARLALRQAVPEADRYLTAGHIEIVPHTSYFSPHQPPAARIEIIQHAEWYLHGGVFIPERVINGWNEKLAQALAAGYAGMRVNGNEAWLTQENWSDFAHYERTLDETLANRRMIVLCSYPLLSAGAAEILDVVRTHQFAVIRRRGTWEMVESPELKQAKAEIQRLNAELEQRVQERTQQLAAMNQQLRREMAERQQVMEALRESEERFATAFRSSPAPCVIVHLSDNRFLDVNDAFLQTFGYTRPEVIGQTALGLELWVNPQAEPPLLQQLHEGRAVRDYEARGRTKQGAILDMLVFSELIDLAGEPCILATAYDVTERKRAEREKAILFAQLQEAHAQLQALSRRLLDVQEAERRHLARELHDEIGQTLTGLKLLLDMSARFPPEAVKSRLSEAQTLVSDLMDRVNELSLDLRPELLDALGLLPTLLGHFERYTAQTNIQVTFRQNGLDGRRFSPQMETTVYRLIQEALTNVARHAGVGEATVRLWVGPDALGVEIEDQGVGFEPEAMGVATGISGMRERVALLGGQLSIESSPGSGTHITVELPLSTPGERSATDDDRSAGG